VLSMAPMFVEMMMRSTLIAMARVMVVVVAVMMAVAVAVAILVALLSRSDISSICKKK